MAATVQDVADWLVEVRELDFSAAIQTLHSKLFSFLEYKRSKRESISSPTMEVVKSVLDAIALKCLEITEKNIILRTKLEDNAEFSERLEEMATRISRLSTATLEVPKINADGVKMRDKGEDFVVIVTPMNEEDDINVVKKDIGRLCRLTPEVPSPRDVVITKRNQIVVKMSNKQDMEKLQTMMTKEAVLKDRVKIFAPRRRRARMIILGVDSEIGEDRIEEVVDRMMKEEMRESPLFHDLRARLLDRDIDQTTRQTLENLTRDSIPEFNIVRKFVTKAGKTNWIIDVDEAGRKILVNRKRVCIYFERYRVVDYIQINRCFKCQAFGHMALNCKGDQHCSKCAGDHKVAVCTSDFEKCVNCIDAGRTESFDHRADSNGCPIYRGLRNDAIVNRS